ncbi:MAG TPA: caspase family protein, partial [Micromonosporaceae bacterium]|nr:caspase family protein [Micromonosporaceae bacterium]
MPGASVARFAFHVSTVDGETDPAGFEELAGALRTELADAGVTRLDPLPTDPAPAGTRGLEVLAICGFVVTAAQTAEALVKVVAAIRRCVARYAERHRPVRLTVGGVDLAVAGDAEIGTVVAALLAAPGRALSGVRKALVIATAGYDDPALARLRAPTHDADALAGVLGDPTIGGFDVELLTEADERTVRRRIAAFFADRDRDDLLLLHFSCHGVKDNRGRLYLAARDTDLATLSATAIPASFVNDQLAETQSRRVVLVLDCCYSGAFARGTVARGSTTVHLVDEFGAGTGRVVLTASSATEYSFEGGDLTAAAGHPSVFTSALVGGLATGAADLDADGEISIDELYDYAYREVRERTPDQTPMKWSFGVEGSLSIARSVRPAALPTAVLDDLASDRVALRLAAVAALKQLLATGRPGLRESASAALLRLRDTDDSMRVRSAAADALGGIAVPATPTPTPAPVAPPPTPVAPSPAPVAPPRVTPPPAAPPAPVHEAAPAPPIPGLPAGPLVAAGLLMLLSITLWETIAYS